MKRKRILPPTYLFVPILVIVVVHFLCPMLKIIPFPWNLLGAIPVTSGLASNLTADRAFKKHKTTVQPFEELATLITKGVFRFTRNPMYLGFMLILIGIATFMGSLTPYVVIPFFAILMDYEAERHRYLYSHRAPDRMPNRAECLTHFYENSYRIYPC